MNDFVGINFDDDSNKIVLLVNRNGCFKNRFHELIFQRIMSLCLEQNVMEVYSDYSKRFIESEVFHEVGK